MCRNLHDRSLFSMGYFLNASPVSQCEPPKFDVQNKLSVNFAIKISHGPERFASRTEVGLALHFVFLSRLGGSRVTAQLKLTCSVRNEFQIRHFLLTMLFIKIIEVYRLEREVNTRYYNTVTHENAHELLILDLLSP